MCVDGSDPIDANLIINGTTCQAYAQRFLGETDASRCTAIQSTYGIYCGCVNNPLLDTTCRLCGNNDDDLLPHPALVLPPSRNDDANTCVQLELEANLGFTGSNVDGVFSSSCETFQGTTAATTCCQASSRPTPSPPTTEPSTAAPTVSPTLNPTTVPTNIPTNLATTNLPTTIPTTTRPTLLPTAGPTTRPTTVAPTTAMPSTTMPTASPSGSSSTTLTSAPTQQQQQEPTQFPTMVPLTTIFAQFSGITLRLVGLPVMNQTNQDNFESALQGWYASLYEQRRRRRQRRLGHDRFLQQQEQQQQQQQEPLPQFQTRVLYQDQNMEPDNDANVVTYDQSISFAQAVNQDVGDLRPILLDPFQDEAAMRRLLNRLRVSDAFFEPLNADTLETPLVPQPKITIDGDTIDNGDNNDSDDDDSSLGLIIGIVAAGLIIVAVLLYLFWRPKEKEEQAMVTTPATERVKRTAREETSDERHPENDEEDAAAIQNEFSTEATPVPISPTKSYDGEESVPHANDYDRSMTKSPVARAKSPRPGPDEDDTPTVSSARENRSERTTATTETGSYMGVLGLESTANDSISHNEPEPPRQETYNVVAPPGKLGVVIDTPSEGPPTVFAVKDTSPLYGKVETGDLLIQVDDEDVSTFSAVKVSKLIGRKAKNPERRFVLRRNLPNLDESSDYVAANGGD